jgi:hypothetical protein
MSLDDLRKRALADSDSDPFAELVGSGGAMAQSQEEDLLFGLNAVERMFLSMGLFMTVSILSFLILLMSGSIQMP